MTTFRIWRGSKLVASVDLEGDETLTIAQDGETVDVDVVGVDARGRVTAWDEDGDVVWLSVEEPSP